MSVGEAKEWIPDLVKRAQDLKVNAGHVPGTDLGPVISPQAKNRILSLVQSGKLNFSNVQNQFDFFILIFFF